MKVEVLSYTPITVAVQAIRTCWDSNHNSDSSLTTIGEKDKELVHRVGNKFKHSSTLEHCSIVFKIEGVSRALLQEMARHRMANISVKSTRYTLKELKKEEPFDGWGSRAMKYLVSTGNADVDEASVKALEALRVILVKGIANDKAKYCLPESYRTSLVWTFNIRSLQNLIFLRSDKSALWEFRELIDVMMMHIPEEYLFLLEEFVYENRKAEEEG